MKATRKVAIAIVLAAAAAVGAWKTAVPSKAKAPLVTIVKTEVVKPDLAILHTWGPFQSAHDSFDPIKPAVVADLDKPVAAKQGEMFFLPFRIRIFLVRRAPVRHYASAPRRHYAAKPSAPKTASRSAPKASSGDGPSWAN
jgi:hypothetical protein